MANEAPSCLRGWRHANCCNPVEVLKCRRSVISPQGRAHVRVGHTWPSIHVKRTLRLLRENHLIEIDGKRVTILDFEALSLLCDFEASYLGDSARALRVTPSVR